MDWQNFELLVAEGFRRLGYVVENRGWYVPNGRVHISLTKGGERMLVDCGQWRGSEVGLAPVRELYQAMASEGADGALLVTSGSFTQDAEAFARDKPIGLVDGKALLELVATVQRQVPRDEHELDAPRCPVCERPMMKKKAGRDSTIGHVYWGCSTYPRCLGTRQV
jgi:restriction system protein